MSKSGVRIDLMGIPELKAAFKRLGRNFAFEIGRALYGEGEVIMGRSKAHFVPVERGPLRASGHVMLPQMEGSGPVVVLGFGGPSVAYAVVQHESLHFKHKVGTAKYLETPAMAQASIMNRTVAERLRKRLKAIVTA